jgi:hypothetical protein
MSVRMHGALPLPVGERAGVRGLRAFACEAGPPSPGALRAPTSPRWGEVEHATPSLLHLTAAWTANPQ